MAWISCPYNACNVQRSTRNVHPATFNAQRSPRNVQRSTFNVQRATFNAQRSTFNPRFACFHARLPDAIKRGRPRSQIVICQVADRIRKPFVRKMSERWVQRSTFNLQRSTFNAQRSTCNVQRATFNLQRSTRNVQPATFNLHPSSRRSLRLLNSSIIFAADSCPRRISPARAPINSDTTA